MPSLDFESEKNLFREYYSDNQNLLREATNFFRSLIESLCASDQEEITPNVISRLKDREECIKKFSRKYQTMLETDKKEYAIKEYITDLIGVRIICYYEPDIPKIAQLLRDNFEVLEESDKSALLEEKDNIFGYKGYHLDLKINAERARLLEYERYKDIRFEVQIRSIIQDAWSVLDHKIKYKKSIPANLKRQINALAALFEIADREFTQIKNVTKALEEGKKEAPKPEEIAPFDVFDFLSITAELMPGVQFKDYKADGFTHEILRCKGDIKPEEFRSALVTYKEKVMQYKEYQAKEQGNVLNAFTQLRHMLYLQDKVIFEKILYDYQRENFEKWLEPM